MAEQCHTDGQASVELVPGYQTSHRNAHASKHTSALGAEMRGVGSPVVMAGKEAERAWGYLCTPFHGGMTQPQQQVHAPSTGHTVPHHIASVCDAAFATPSSFLLPVAVRPAGAPAPCQSAVLLSLSSGCLSCHAAGPRAAACCHTSPAPARHGHREHACGQHGPAGSVQPAGAPCLGLRLLLAAAARGWGQCG